MRLRTLSACALLAACVSLWGSAAARAHVGQTPPAAGQAKPADAKVSDAERKAAEKINLATDNAAKLAAVTEFINKYPKSTLRPRIGEAFAGMVNSTDDTAQRITAAEAYLKLFNEPGESDRVTAALLDAYLISGRAEESYRLGGEYLAKNPDDVDMMRRLAIVALNEAIKGNNKFVEQGQKYGAKALELIETDKRPASTDAAQWTEYKTKWLPAVYRESGFLAMQAGDKAAARVRLTKAAELKSPDPVVYAVIGQMNDEDYATMAGQYQKMAAGAEKTAMLKKVQEQMDKAIEYYAQSIAMAGDRPEYEQLRAQVRPGLEEYYKFRHSGSTNGLQQFIDKYKPAPAAP
ncbi:MAG: hypothetical protein H0T60_02380 [Acidobacteria bacterium]|nr:hypothetical protein [Acidobacteriota bacterium]